MSTECLTNAYRRHSSTEKFRKENASMVTGKNATMTVMTPSKPHLRTSTYEQSWEEVVPQRVYSSRHWLDQQSEYSQKLCQHETSQLMRLWCFLCSVNSSFKRAYAAIQWGCMSDFWPDPSSTSILYVCEQRRRWLDCADAQARLSLRCSPM